jgi:hypothetical protein
MGGGVMSNVMPVFYDVPCVATISQPRHDNYTNQRVGGQMLIAIFDCAFEAMSFASRNGGLHGFGPPLLVNRRPWGESVFNNSRILDLRKVES